MRRPGVNKKHPRKSLNTSPTQVVLGASCWKDAFTQTLEVWYNMMQRRHPECLTRVLTCPTLKNHHISPFLKTEADHFWLLSWVAIHAEFRVWKQLARAGINLKAKLKDGSTFNHVCASFNLGKCLSVICMLRCNCGWVRTSYGTTPLDEGVLHSSGDLRLLLAFDCESEALQSLAWPADQEEVNKVLGFHDD